MRKYWYLLSLFFFYSSVYGQLTYSKNDNYNYFSISYTNSFTPDSVKRVIEKTTLDISKYINSNIPINIRVDWIAQKANIQASCTPNGLITNFKNCPNNKVLYPISLAEKIADEELNKSSEADIVMLINKNMSWYYGLDGLPNSSSVDLYTILLHEICHGIGIQTNFTADNINGKLYGTGIPLIFDLFIKDSLNISLLNSNKYPLNSNLLYKALISDSLTFSGNFEHVLNNDLSAKLYAPSQYNPGSSICHLDYNIYPKGNINSLLNYTKVYGESIHDLGPITKGILADLGWNDFLISVNKLHDNENMNYKPEILVYIDSIFNPNTLQLHYSFDHFANELTLAFAKTDTANYYKAHIPNSFFDHSVSYYITVKDKINAILTGIPNNYPYNYYSFNIGKDTLKPIINHNAITEISEDMDTLLVNAKVTDNVGLDSVWVEYLINSSDTSKSKKIKLTKTSFDNYQTTIVLKKLIKEKNTFMYKLYALDSSSNHNINSTIGNGKYSFYQISVGPKSLPFVSFEDSFEDSIKSKDEFIISTNNNTSDFIISKPKGFSNYALHSKHPYPTALYTGKTLDLTAMIKNPVTIRSQEAYLEFDEIALIEPSESGTIYGDYEFWDYCIIEGSKDKANWYPFELKGYKTELYSDWLATFYSETTTDNNGKISSTAEGDESIYHHHKVNLLGNKYLRKGDNVYIRFRLFSDAFQNAWGWSIDNLKIQMTPVYETIICKDILVFPTISSNTFTIRSENIISKIETVSVLGVSTSCQIVNIDKKNYSISINSKPGIYLLKIRFEDDSFVFRKVILKD